MSVENLKTELPEYAKDLKLNLGSLSRTTELNEQQLYDYGIYRIRQQLAPIQGITLPTPAGEPAWLSEARKYRLGLILAHQYLDQLEKENKLSGAVSLKGAVFGNVGTMMFYKIGPQDTEVCAKEMAPVFSEQDLVNLESFKGAMKLSIDGQHFSSLFPDDRSAWKSLNAKRPDVK